MIRQDIIDRFRVPTDGKVRLKDYDPGWKQGAEFEDLGKDAIKERAQEVLAQNLADLAEAQDLLYADDRYAVLIVLQAMDAAGKDGTIKHVMSGVNPQGCQVFSFKKPSAEDLDHNFLWRYMKCLPERGRIGIFNRSYYEDVLVVKVHPELISRQLPRKKDKIGKKFWDAVRGHQRFRTASGAQRDADPEVLPERVQGRAEGPVPGAAEPAGEELEVLGRRPGRAGVLGRLHGGVRGCARGDEHEVGAVVRDPGRLQVGDAGRGRGHRHDVDPGNRPEVPGGHRGDGKAAG